MILSTNLQRIKESILYKKSINENIQGEFIKIRNSKEIKEEISRITEFLNSVYCDIENSQRIWHIVYNIENIENCICGKPRMFYRFSDGYHITCGDIICKNKQKSLKFKNTISEKYEGNYFGIGSETRDKYEKTMLERYNTKHNFSGNLRDGIKNTMIEKYGVEHPLQSKDILKKRNQTCIDRHNTLNFIQSDKTKNTMENLYNGNPMKSEEIKKKVTESSRRKKYKHLSEKLNIFNIELLEYKNNLVSTKCNKCNTILELHPVTMNAKLRKNIDVCTFCNPPILTHSIAEKELLEFIKTIYNGSVIANKKLINNNKSNYEIDIYLPDINIAFEYNGLYWHSELYKDPGYHKFKTDELLKKGISLYHIWEDDWIYNQDLCKSMISNIIGKSNRVYARKCKIDIISNSEYKKFCEENHLQGYGIAAIRIGLFHNNTLVSVFGISKSRSIITKDKNSRHYELIRFCTLINNTVIGGASKMLKYFIDEYRPLKIDTYCDVSLSPSPDNSVYQKIGFILEKYTDPGFSWVIDNKRVHRLNFMKHKLVNNGEDKSLTANEIMHKKGYYRIWDCGNRKYSITL